MEIKPIWISSINHLNTFSNIIRTTPSWRKLIGFYKIPDDFPMVKLNYVLPMPIVYFSKGEISLDDVNLSYKSINEKIGFLKSYSNLNNNLSFEIEISDIESLQRYKHQKAFINYYNIEWIRIKCDEDILGGDFLVCIGGYGPLMNKINKNNENLFEKLIKLQNPKVD